MGRSVFHGRRHCHKLLAVSNSKGQALDEDDNLIGVVISKLEPHRGGPMRGYIAMLAVREGYRGKGIATELVRRTLDVMIERDADEVLHSRTFC